MSSSFDRVRVELRRFLDGGAFGPLWRAVMDATELVDTYPGVTDAEQRWYEAVYDLVPMGAEDPVSPADRATGIVGAAELRAMLRPLASEQRIVPPSRDDMSLGT